VLSVIASPDLSGRSNLIEIATSAFGLLAMTAMPRKTWLRRQF